MPQLKLHSSAPQQVIDITDQVLGALGQRSQEAGAVVIMVAHTTAAVTTADLDPGMEQNTLEFLQALVPAIEFDHHNPAHTPAHIWASIIGPSIVVPLRSGRLQLGNWQRIVLVELDGPRERNVIVQAM